MLHYRTIAITPSKSRSMEPEVVKRVCQTFAVDGLRMLVESSPARPFRYLYVSGKLAERDQTKKPILAPEYFLMRVSILPLCTHRPSRPCSSDDDNGPQGQTENMVLKIGEESNGAVEVGIAKPGLIPKPGISLESIAATMGQALSLPLISTVNREECAAAMLDQVVNGFEKETMTNEDLKRIGKRALRQQAE